MLVVCICVTNLFYLFLKRGEKLTHEEVQAIIDDADYNKDGKLDYAEASTSCVDIF